MTSNYFFLKRSSIQYQCLAFSIIFSLVYYFLLFEGIQPKIVENHRILFSDFAYYIEVARAVWFGYHHTVYDVGTLQKLFSEQLQSPILGVLPVNLTPTGLVLIFPFLIIAELNLLFAQTSFITLSLIFVAAGVISIVRTLPTELSIYSLVMLILACFFNDTILSCLINGQSSLFLLGNFLWLYYRFEQAPNKTKPLSLIESLWYVIAASIKPHYLLIMVYILWSYKQYRAIVVGLAATLICFAMLTPRLGLYWPVDYLKWSLLLHLHEVPSEAFKGLFPSNLAIFKVAALPFLTEELASKIGLIVLILSALVLLRLSLRNSATSSHSHRKIFNPAWLFFIFISLFSPYFPIYDELLTNTIFLIVGLMAVQCQHSKLFITVLVSCIVANNFPLWNSILSTSYVWLGKLCLFSLILYFYKGVKIQPRQPTKLTVD